MRAVSAVVIMLVASGAAHAGPRYGPWVSGRFGGGGYVQNVVPAPSDPRRLYAYVDVGGAFRSDDGGRHWRMIHGGLPASEASPQCRGLDVDPRDADTLLYAAGGIVEPALGLFRSTDGGASWSKVLAAQFWANEEHRYTGFVLGRDPANPGVVLAATGGDGVWRSADGGATWARAAGALDVNATDLDWDPAVPGRVWVSAQPFATPTKQMLYGQMRPVRRLAGGLWRSDDGGRSFVRARADGPRELVLRGGAMLGLFDEGRALRLSRDGAASWAEYRQGLPPLHSVPHQSSADAFSSEVQAATAGPDGWLIATMLGDVYRRGDTDAAWRKVERRAVDKGDWWGDVPPRAGWTHFGKAAGSLTLDPRDPRHMWMTDWYAIWESTDAGANWTARIEGLETTVIHSLLQDPADPARVHLGMADNGYVRSLDGGGRWVRPRASFNNAKTLAASPRAPRLMWGTGTAGGEWIAEALFRSEDGGARWARVATAGLPAAKGNTVNSIAAHPGRVGEVYAAVAGPGGGVFVSRDRGARWTRYGAGFAHGDDQFAPGIWEAGRQLAAGPDGALAAAGLARPLQRYVPATGRWETPALGPEGVTYEVHADARRAGRFFAAGTAGVWRSEDGGATWARVLDRPARRVATDLARDDRVVVGAIDGVWVSTDGGASFRALSAALPNRSYPVVASAGGRVIAGTLGDGVFWTEAP